jgi:hypothetical protein
MVHAGYERHLNQVKLADLVFAATWAPVLRLLGLLTSALSLQSAICNLHQLQASWVVDR